jgi:uncharacterized protein (TIGR03083 family)
MGLTAYPDELADLDVFGLFDTEVGRCDRRFVRASSSRGWEEPTACEGWSVRDLLAHLRHSHRYDVACLENDLPGLFAEAAESGVSDLKTFNDWGVRLGRGRDVDELLEEWRGVSADVRRRFRERGRDGTIPTMVGEYNVGLQALHLAFEHAVHADDMQADVGEEERAGRTAWQARFARWTLANEKEEGAPGIEVGDGVNHVTAGGGSATLSDEELVRALTGRLGADRLPDEEVRAALRGFG